MQKTVIISWNVRSAVHQQREHALHQNLAQYPDHVFCLQETHRNQTEYITATHAIFGTPLASIAIPRAVSQKEKPRYTSPNERTTFLKLTHLNIVSIYAPACSCPQEEITLFWSNLQEFLEQELSMNLVVAGDFNLNILRDNIASNTCQALNLHPTTKHVAPTFKGAGIFAASQIDFIVMTTDLSAKHTRTRNPAHYHNMFDHKQVIAEICCHHQQPTTTRQPTTKYSDSKQGLILNQLKQRQAARNTHTDESLLIYHPSVKQSPETKYARMLLKEDIQQCTINGQANHTHWHAIRTITDSKQKDAVKAYAPIATKIQLACAASTSTRQLFASLKHIMHKRKLVRHLTGNAEKLAIELHFSTLLTTPGVHQQVDANFLPPTPTPPLTRKITNPSRHIFTDGSAYNHNSTDFTCGAAIFNPDSYVAHSIHLPKSTINEAEATAFCMALQHYPLDSVTVHTDSEVCCKKFFNLATLARNDFENVPHAPLWRYIYSETLTREIDCVHVRSHNKIEYNEIVDKIAKCAALHVIPHFKSYQIPNECSWATMNDDLGISIAFSNSEETPLCQRHHPPNLASLPNTIPHDSPPTRNEILLAIQQLPQNKSPGPDGITNECLRDKSNLDSICELVQEIWQTKAINAEACSSTLIIIPKPGERTLKPPNIRGISLANTISKMMMRIILNRNPNPPILQQQIGFMRGRSTAHGIHAVKTLLHQCTSQGKGIALCFIDISKAFDNVPRDFLQALLPQYGFSATATTKGGLDYYAGWIIMQVDYYAAGLLCSPVN